MGQLLTTESVLMCPHGGTVTAITTDIATQAGGAFVVLATDTFLVAGCPFMLPSVPPVPDPCIMVQWVTSALANTVMGVPVLTMDSVGLCISALGAPAGPVMVVDTQLPVDGM
jgi:hypothetical protein